MSLLGFAPKTTFSTFAQRAVSIAQNRSNQNSETAGSIASNAGYGIETAGTMALFSPVCTTSDSASCFSTASSSASTGSTGSIGTFA